MKTNTERGGMGGGGGGEIAELSRGQPLTSAYPNRKSKSRRGYKEYIKLTHSGLTLLQTFFVINTKLTLCI